MSKQGATLAGVMDAFSMSISIGLQYGVSLEAFISKYIKMRFDPVGRTDDADIRIAQSVMDYLFRRLALDYLPVDKRAELGIFLAEERAATVAGYGSAAPAAENEDVNVEALAQGVPVEAARRAPVAGAPTAAVGSSMELLEAMQGIGADAPLWMTCGTKMRPAGSCYVCEGCGYSWVRYQLPTANCQLPTANCQLPTANCQRAGRIPRPSVCQDEPADAHKRHRARATRARTRTMLANQTDFQKLLTGTKVFIVPIFQRRYKWSQKEWAELWDDLMLQYRGGGTDPGSLHREGEGHFLGSIVLHPAPGPASTVARYLLIDGQQRVTTLLTLIAAMRDFRLKLQPEWPKEAYDNVYLRNEFKPNDPYRLMPGKFDREAFEATLFEATPTGQVGNAYLWFMRALKRAQAEDPVDFERLERAILLRLLAVEITTSSSDNVNHIFHTLNFSGMRLSAVDLIRNFVLMQLSPNDAEDAHDDLWMPLEQMMNDKQLHRYLYAQLVRRDRHVRQRDIYVPFEGYMQRQLTQAQDRRQVVLEELGRLNDEADVFRFIEAPWDADFNEPWISPHIRSAVGELAAWGASPPVPLVLELLCRLRGRRAAEADVLEALTYLLSFLVRRSLAGMATNNLNRLISPIASVLTDAKPLAEQVRTALGGDPRQWPDDDVLREIGPRTALYRTSRPPQVKYLLSRLERVLEPKEPVELDGLTVEHILPQKLSAAWRRDLLKAGDDIEVAETRRHCLGNLTLTGYNSELAQRPFGEKRVEYASSALEMNRKLAQASVWSVTEIDARSAELLEIALIHFARPALSPGSTVGEDGIERRSLEDVLLAVPGDRFLSIETLSDVLARAASGLAGALEALPASLASRVLAAGGKCPSYGGPARMAELAEQLTAQGGDLSGVVFPDMREMLAGELQELLQRLDEDEPDESEFDMAAQQVATA